MAARARKSVAKPASVVRTLPEVVAAGDQRAALEALRARRKRGTKLVPWICLCPKLTVQVPYGADFRAVCQRCGETYRRKSPDPAHDLAAFDLDEETPF